MTPEQFLAFAQVLPEPLLLLDSTGQILAVNAAQTTLLGLSHDVLVGKPLAAFVTGEPDKVMEYLQLCTRSRTLVLGSLTFQTHDGDPVVCRCEGAVVRPWSKDAAALVLLRLRAKASASQHFLLLNQKIDELSREIRERKRAEVEVFHQREQLRVTLASIGDGVIVTDVQGQISFMNPVAELLTGWKQAEAIGQPLAAVFQIINEHTREPSENPVIQVLQEGVIVGLANHTLLIAKDGTERAIADSGAPIRDERGTLLGVVLVFRDVTEEHRSQQQESLLAEVTTILATSLDYETTLGSVVRLIVPRIADWCVVHEMAAGGTLQQVVVAPGSDALEQGIDTVALTAWLEADAPEDLSEVIRTGQSRFLPVIPAEILATFAHTAEYAQFLAHRQLTSLMSVPLRGHEQTFGALTFVARQPRHYTHDDVLFAEELARRVANALDNARLYQEAQRAVQVRDTFISIAAHELRTPLTTLLGNAQLLSRRVDDIGNLAERERRSLHIIVEQVSRLNRMIDTLLDISRIESGQLNLERAPVDVGALVGRVVGEMQPTLEKHTLVCTLPDEALIVSGDALRLEQTLHNLIGNAVRYSPSGGVVEVEVAQRGNTTCMRVRDHGIGIPAEEISRLFQRFYRASNASPQYLSGMGIGLYVVKEIVTLHDGTVEVESIEGSETTVTISLPLAER